MFIFRQPSPRLGHMTAASSAACRRAYGATLQACGLSIYDIISDLTLACPAQIMCIQSLQKKFVVQIFPY